MKKKTLCLLLASMMAAGCIIGCGSKETVKNETDNKEEKAPTYYELLGFETVEKEEDLLAFPGAEGYGKHTKGGRGGRVIEVTNLNDSGEGSLRAAIEAEGPRVVVFKVSGNIMLESALRVTNPYITIAGQTAPGEGICLRNYNMIVETQEAIVSYLRIRPANTTDPQDCLWVNKSENVVVNNISASFATDEDLSVSDSTSVTVQNCIIAESLNKTKLGTHGMGSLIRGSKGQKVTFYQNLYANHRSRMPMSGNYTEYTEDPEGFYMEFINNVCYNWSGKASGKNHDVNCVSSFNLVNNYYLPGPVTQEDGAHAWSQGCSKSHMYIAGNAMNGEVPEDQKSLVYVDMEEGNDPFDESAYYIERFQHSITKNILDAKDVYDSVLAKAGCSIVRDSLDEGVVDSVKNNTGKLVNKPEDAAGWTGEWPVAEGAEAYTDADGDGMDDAWEKEVGLNPEDGTDGNAIVAGGYTNLEVFLESLKQK